MLEAVKYSAQGNKVGTVKLDERIFAVTTLNKNALLYEVINMYLANQRQGTSSVRGRSEVRGSTAKMYRQKGTGNARAGHRRSPVRVGGGVAFGPRPKDWYRHIPKKKKRLALKVVLSDKAAGGNIFVIESLSFDSPQTKQAISLINSIVPHKGRKLLIMEDSNQNIIKSFSNVPDMQTDRADSIFPYEILKSQYILVTEEALNIISNNFAPQKGKVATRIDELHVSDNA